MRKILLTSVAVAALAGVTVANAQTGSDHRKDQPTATTTQQPSGKAGAREEKGNARPSAQKTESGGSKASQAGQSSRPNERSTTGSAGSQGTESKPKAAERPQRGEQGREQGAQNQPSGDMKKSGASGDMKKRQTTGSSTQGMQPNEQKSTAQPSSRGAAQKSKEERSTTGQAPANQPGTAPNASTQKSKERSTTGQSPQSPSGSPADRNRQEQNRATQDRANQPGQPQGQAGQTQSGTSTSQPGARQGGTSSTGAALNPAPEQQSKISEAFSKQKVKSVTDTNVSFSVGSSLPSSVRTYDVPRDVVTIYPQYRGYRYSVVRDEIIIIEPRTHKVVSVIPRSGRTTTGAATSSTSSTLRLAPEKKRIIHETVLKEGSAPRCSDVQISVGAQVPRSLELGPLPGNLTREVPEISSYQFCLKGNEVVLVDPREFRVVEVIQ